MLSLQLSSTPKRREAKIFSIVHSLQRDKNGSRSSNNSSLKEAKPGLSLVSKEKKRASESISKSKEGAIPITPFAKTPAPLKENPTDQAEKENKPNLAMLKIKQPEFLKVHPLRLGRMNGSCMSKLIVQRALQDRQHCFPVPPGQSRF
jgi:hypothetical protein